MLQPILGSLNLLDCTLVMLLVAVIPVIQILASLRRRANRTLVQRYRRTMLFMGIPLALLAMDWLSSGRGAASLGLGIPVPLRGEIGIAIALIAFIAVALWPRPKRRKSDDLYRQMKQAGMLITTSKEFGLFLPLTLMVGCGAEILFRGFLLWAFAPFVGLSGAVVVAALAYGFGHGSTSRKQLAGSVVSAFLFTAAYAASGSLWWLMLVHTGLMLHGGWTGFRLARVQPV